MSGTVVVVEDEIDLAQLLSVRLELDGFRCVHAARGEDALEVVLEERPDLVLLDLVLPGVDGIAVCRLLRKDPRTSSIGIIILTARSLPEERIAGLEAGADDYVNKPFDVDEVIARMHTLLRRARQLRGTSPLTGLPGNFEIEARIAACIADGAGFALLHVDIDRFKAFNDHYGFLRGDAAILLTARIVQNAAPESFVGHIGGDDFAVLCEPDRAEAIATAICAEFDLVAPALYDDEDRDRGYLVRIDRRGKRHAEPFVTISVGIASTNVRGYTASAEAATVAVDMKRVAKDISGSVWRVDRRRGR